MTYLRSYVNTMLKNHTYGDEFRSIRDLSNVEGSPYNYRDESVSLKILGFSINILLSLIGFGPGVFGGRSHHRSQRKYDATEEALAKTSKLIKQLDSSNDSQWLATYMVEEGIRNCEKTKEMFEKYIESCKQ